MDFEFTAFTSTYLTCMQLLFVQSSPYFDPTHTRTGWIGQPPILNRHGVVTIDGDVDTLGQATPVGVCMYAGAKARVRG